jgi:serine/threonine protein kinase/WD40 repeat protein
MATSSPQLAQLSNAERVQLESWLIEFDLRWDADRLAGRARDLPAQGAFRRTALTEMIKIDLERRWQRGHPVGVEFYMDSYPELGSRGGPPLELVEAEVTVRAQLGAPADETELCGRFPELREQIGRLLRTRPSRQELLRTPGPGDGPSTASPSTDAPRELSGAFGRYHISRTLGQGGMGTVYLANDTQLGRPVALKVPHAFSAKDAVARERFRREGRAAAALDHPNLCRVYDVGEHDGVPFLTMAFIEGRPLGDPAAGPLAADRIAAVVGTIARALAYAHARGVIHRDLKPSNVLIDAQGEPIVTDFGLARRDDAGDAQLSRDGEPLGTPAYMSPEQVAGRTEAVGPASDIFSLGVILYQLLTGRLPFRGGVGEVMIQIAVEDPPRPSAVRPGIDPRLEAACLKALEKAPANRFGSMDEFAAALDAEPAPAVKPVRAGPSRRWRRIAAGLALLSVAAAGLIVRCERDGRDSAQLKNDANDERNGEVAGNSAGGPPPRVEPVTEVAPVVLRGHEHGVTAVAFAGPDQVVSADEWSVRTWDRTTGKKLFDSGKKSLEWKRYDIAISPDGRRFVDHFIGSVQLQDARTGEELLRENATGQHKGPKAFAANGKAVALATQSTLGDTATVVWNFDANTFYTFAKYRDARGLVAVALTADGKRGASASTTAEDGVRVWDVESGNELRHWPKSPATAVAFTPDGKFVLTGTVLGALVLRDPGTGAEVGRFEGHTDRISAVAFSAGGKRMLSASADGTARVWDVAARRELQLLKGHAGVVTCCALAADGALAVTGGEDKTVRVWTLPATTP